MQDYFLYSDRNKRGGWTLVHHKVATCYNVTWRSQVWNTKGASLHMELGLCTSNLPQALQWCKPCVPGHLSFGRNKGANLHYKHSKKHWTTLELTKSLMQGFNFILNVLINWNSSLLSPKLQIIHSTFPLWLFSQLFH